MLEVSVPTPRPYTVHIYQCPNDRTTMVTPFKAEYGDPYICPLCRRWMKRLYSVQTAVRLTAPVYNPQPGLLEPKP